MHVLVLIPNINETSDLFCVLDSHTMGLTLSINFFNTLKYRIAIYLLVLVDLCIHYLTYNTFDFNVS